MIKIFRYIYFIAILARADKLIDESKDLKDYRKKLKALDKAERKRIMNSFKKKKKNEKT